MLQEHDWITVYLTSIRSRLYDLALEMLTKRESLASARGVEDSETGLHVLARKHTLCDCERYWRPEHSCRDTPIFRLMKRMLDILITSQDLERREAVTEATEATLIVVETGNFDFVSTIMRVYPNLDLVYE
ncbi:ankyrin repeat-containing protein ITN1 [Trifolium repens]|nr:ankyrin repeat-containing protein ITN1 [Trifolium repens]